MNSPGHFANTINKDWTRVGVGIYYKGSSIYVTIVFSVRDLALYPVTETEKAGVISQLSAYITSRNPNVKVKIDSLSTHLTNWLAANRNPPSIFDYLRAVGYPLTSMSYSMAQGSWSANIANTFINNGYFVASSPAFTKYGMGISVGTTGLTTVAVVFSI